MSIIGEQGPVVKVPPYSLFKSKTFWTMALQLTLNVLDAVVHPTTGTSLLPPGALTAANMLLFGLAATFHKWTGDSTSGTNEYRR